MAFKYKIRSPELLEKRANAQGGDFQGIIRDEYKTFVPAKGDNHIRFLPPTWENPEHYGLDVWAHYNIGPDHASILCLNRMRNNRCPICEARVRAERAGDDELAKELSARKRVLVWMLDRKDESKGPMIWSMAQTLDRDFVKLCRDKTTGEIYYIDHPEQGYNVSFERTGEKLATRYGGLQIARRASSVDQDVLDYVEAEPLTGTLVWLSYEEIKEIYEGGADPDATDEPVVKAKVNGTRQAEAKQSAWQRPAGKAKAAPQDEADDETEEEADDEPEEEAEPVKPSVKVRVRQREPEDDEPVKPTVKVKVRVRQPDPEPEEEEVDDEPPVKAKTPPPGSNGKSRAQELRERFGR